MNRVIWKYIFSKLSYISDNTYVMTCTVTICFAIIITFLFRKYVNAIPIVATGYMFSLSYAIRDLPFIHKRIHTALDVTANILLASKNYLEEFKAVTDIAEPTKLKIINVLYYLDHKSELTNTQPTELYEHFYSTMDKTRLGFLGYIDKNAVPINSYLIVVIICLLSLGLLIHIKKKNVFRVYMEMILIAISMFFCIGTTINMVVFIIIERIYVFSFKNFKFPKKKSQKKHIKCELINQRSDGDCL